MDIFYPVNQNTLDFEQNRFFDPVNQSTLLMRAKRAGLLSTRMHF